MTCSRHRCKRRLKENLGVSKVQAFCIFLTLARPFSAVRFEGGLADSGGDHKLTVIFALYCLYIYKILEYDHLVPKWV